MPPAQVLRHFGGGAEGGWARAAWSAPGSAGEAADVADVMAFLVSDAGRRITDSRVGTTGGSLP
ncbi:hypothetical protein [Streptomyces shenzhenensis]|uniref:Short-chain dehydrogenase n=1 Tax=Streptomyces shenzhenensis TaxID=943815 RepID=A0A3M0IF31_9ACTN|nr:hypothetical protein CTZ28_00405 [Streptomyces shenzhenensis]